MPTGTHTSFGRYQVAETPSSVRRLHFPSAEEVEALKTVDHEPKMAVLDQEDLVRQGINTSIIVPGAPIVDALGSCVLNSNTVALSNVMPQGTFLSMTGCTSYTDTKGGEVFAIRSYAGCTHQTGDPSQEWPPTDCGSSGPYAYSYDQTFHAVTSERIANDAMSLLSFLQADGVMVGGPWFNSWMEPGGDQFVDGDGSVDAMNAAISSGVAGGHERYIAAIEWITLTETGQVDPLHTILRERNSWSRSWADDGSHYLHLSTYMYLLAQSDFRQLCA